VQGASFAFIPPIEVFKSLYECPKWETNNTDVNNVTYKLTSGFMFSPAGSNPENEWTERIAMVGRHLRMKRDTTYCRYKAVY
jgi:hypothetical protein